MGKTHLAIALAIKACYYGFRVYFTTMHTLVTKLKESQAKGKPYLNSSLVIVDEVGYLPVTSQEAYLFFQFVTYRYEKSSTIITSNKSFSDWQDLFGDPVIASAILDRLLQHCRVINMKGHSCRLQGDAFARQLSRKGGDSRISASPAREGLSHEVVHFYIPIDTVPRRFEMLLVDQAHKLQVLS